MTKKMKQELNNLKYISMADFSKRIDEIKNIDDKLAFASEYILCYEDDKEYSISEAINIARMKIADAIISYKELVRKNELAILSKEAFPEDESSQIDLKPYGNVLNNKKVNKFMASPALFLKKYGEDRLEEAPQKDLTVFEKNKYDNIERNTNAIKGGGLYLNLKLKDRYFLHINARLEAKFSSVKALNAAVKSTRPTFFSRMFNTSSTEGKNLLVAYKGFNDSKSPLYGRIDTLERAANNYLKHIYPNWDKDYPLPDTHLVSQLSGTQKTRVILCNSILEAIRKENKITDEYSEATNYSPKIEVNITDMVEENVIQKTSIENLKDEVEFSFSSDNYIDSQTPNNNNNIENDEVSI